MLTRCYLFAKKVLKAKKDEVNNVSSMTKLQQGRIDKLANKTLKKSVVNEKVSEAPNADARKASEQKRQSKKEKIDVLYADAVKTLSSILAQTPLGVPRVKLLMLAIAH